MVMKITSVSQLRIHIIINSIIIIIIIIIIMIS